MLCPDCGRIVRRFKIWPNLEFYLDRCGGCNGIWFDQHEWEVFNEHWSVKNLNMFFTDEWQQKLKKKRWHHDLVPCIWRDLAKMTTIKFKKSENGFMLIPIKIN